MNALRALLMALVGLFIGLTAGFLLPLAIPAAWSVYAAVLMLCLFHGLLGAIRAQLQGSFATAEFVLGLLGNAAAALALCFLGDRLAVPMYAAAILYFGWGVFTNLAAIRRHFTLHEGQHSPDWPENHK